MKTRGEKTCSITTSQSVLGLRPDKTFAEVQRCLSDLKCSILRCHGRHKDNYTIASSDRADYDEMLTQQTTMTTSNILFPLFLSSRCFCATIKWLQHSNGKKCLDYHSLICIVGVCSRLSISLQDLHTGVWVEIN